MSGRTTFGIILALMLTAQPGLAQTNLILPDGKDWKHEATGFTSPAKVGGFARFRATDYGSTQSDVSFSYRDEATGTIATVYLFRAGLPDVSIWADRAESSIVQIAAQSYGTLDTSGRRWSTVSLWPNSPNAALRVFYPLSGKELKSTGLLVGRHGDWLVKLRISSTKLDVAGLESLMTSFFAGLALPAPKVGEAPAYAIQSCEDALPQNEAKLVPASDTEAQLTSALLASTTFAAAADGKAIKGAVAKAGKRYCRDAASQSGYGVYRPDGSRSSYFLAAGDGGVSFVVAPDPAAQITKTYPGQYSLTLITSDRVIGFVPYLQMPSPSQAFSALEKSKPTFISSRLPGNKAIQIMVPQPSK